MLTKNTPSSTPGRFVDKFATREDFMYVLRRRRKKTFLRLFLQLEILFLSFFIPSVILQLQSQDNVEFLMTQFVDLPYTVQAAAQKDSLRDYSQPVTNTYQQSFNDVNEFWSWVDTAIFRAIYVSNSERRIGRNQQAPKVVAPIRFRQVRVNPSSSCPYYASLMNTTCYAAFSAANEAQADATFGIDPFTNQTGIYTWSTQGGLLFFLRGKQE